MSPRRQQLRVHGGEAGGRRLQAPPEVRPTQGVVKEAIFNMLGGLPVGAAVLDLYSGSGALGIEALSRGAASVTFVELAQSSVSILRRNLDALGYGSRSRVIRADAVRWLRAHPADVASARLVFLDPPYGDSSLGPALRELDAACAACTVVVEHARRSPLPELARLRPLRERVYGDTAVALLAAA